MHGWRNRVSMVLMGLVILVTFVVGGLSIWFVEDPFPYEARVLITTFAACLTAAAVVAAAQAYRHGSRLGYLTLWVYPAFFVSHVVMLETYAADLTLAAVSAGALLLVWPEMVPSGQKATAATAPSS